MASDRIERERAMIAHDGIYWDNYDRVAGMDEAGRGPLAGDVIAACVVMPPKPVLDWVDDSKKLSAKRRDLVYEEILKTALFIGVGRADPKEIDEINILQATMNAMRRAAAGSQAGIYLIDAVKGLNLDAQELPIIHGDAVSYSIAAASIIAKVTRDREMEVMDALYPEYGFAQHKGYGTAQHIAAIKKYGPCPIHRMSFIQKFI